MGLIDTLRALFGGDEGESPRGGNEPGSRSAGGRGDGGDESDGEQPLYGPVARVYVETGEAPDEEWAAAERDGVVEVLVTAAGEPTPEEPVDTETVEAHLESLDGAVEHAHGGGTISGLVHKSRLGELGAHEDVVRVEVIRTGGDVTEDPDYPGSELDESEGEGEGGDESSDGDEE